MLLHEKLLDLQRDLGKRDDEMATIIGIPRTTYSAIKTERHRISLSVAKLIVAAFPDLADVALVIEPEVPSKPRRPPNREASAVRLLEKLGYTVTAPS